MDKLLADIQDICASSTKINGPIDQEDYENPVVVEEEEEQHPYYNDYVQNQYDYNDYEPKQTLLEAAPDEEEEYNYNTNYVGADYKQFGY